MKVIIDLIEDIREAIENETSFSLVAMALKEHDSGELIPSWESPICSMKIDEETKRLFLFLGKGEALGIESFLESVDTLPNKTMMHEVLLSYSKEAKRIDSSLIGFGESFEEKKYFLFILEEQGE
ncbi:MAG: hypothetical protein IBX43_04415 [Campylobacterales bacterium]|nr:hypothetical protein [Campylobacterales bacterium]